MWFRKRYYAKTIQELKGRNADISIRAIPCAGETLTVLYIKQLTDRQMLSEYVIQPLVAYCATAKKPLGAAATMDGVLFADDCKLESDGAKIETHILNGMAVLLLSADKQYIVVNTKKVESRSIPEPEMQYTLRGPRDCFVENLDVNLSLVRYRVKDPNLRVEYLKAGVRTSTRMALLYIADVASDTCVNEIKKRIQQINADGFLESGEIQSYLLNSRFSLFPNMLTIERSDMAGEMLLEGKALLLVEGSNQVLAAPVVFSEFMYSCDDRYDNMYVGMFMRLLRYAGFFISFTASSYWVAMVSFHPDVMPSNFIIAIAQSRSKTPFSAVLGALVLEFIMELIREALLRVPEKIGSAIAIVGAIIIGQAGIASGVFSPLLLILISVEFLASFSMPNYVLTNPLRIIKVLLLTITSMFGFYGLILGITVIVMEIVSINSFGVPYLAPFGPFNLYDFLRTFMYNKRISKKRPQYLRNKDNTRTK